MVAITINFFLPRMMKGDPITAYLARNQGKVSPEAVESLKILFGLNTDRSLWEQYFDYWGLLISGNLGRSLSKGLAPVTDIIAEALPWTIGLVGIATFLISFFGGDHHRHLHRLEGGGARRSSWSQSLTFLSTVPYFWLGLIIIAVFSTALGWFRLARLSTRRWSTEVRAGSSSAA